MLPAWFWCQYRHASPTPQDCAVRPDLESLSSLTTLTHLEVSLHHTFVDRHTLVLPGEPAFQIQQQEQQQQLQVQLGAGGGVEDVGEVTAVEQSAAEVVFCEVTSW